MRQMSDKRRFALPYAHQSRVSTTGRAPGPRAIGLDGSGDVEARCVVWTGWRVALIWTARCE